MNENLAPEEKTNALQKLGFAMYVIAFSILLVWYPLILFMGTFRFQ